MKTIINTYLSQIGQIPLLTKEQESSLLKKACAGDLAARNQVISANLRYVITIAKKFVNRGVDFADLISAGNLGLIKAIEHFDTSKEVKFITYATYWVYEYMKSEIFNTGRCVHIPKQQKQELKKDTWKAASLYAPLENSDDAGINLSDILKDGANPSPEEEFFNKTFVEDCFFQLKKLKPSEQFVLEHHFGVKGGTSQSLSQIGQQLGISREGARLLEMRAIKNLKTNRLLALYAGKEVA